jgi:PAS domain S-box-containing protein
MCYRISHMTAEGGARLLFVDPTGALADRFRTCVTEAGYDVTEVATGGDCLTLLEDADVDGVVSAYDLPDIDGVRLLRSIRISYPALPFVLAPEDGSGSLAGDAIAAGVTGYVAPDDDPRIVLDRLRDGPDRVHPHGDDEGHSRYRHLIEMSPAPINVFDESGESIWCNRAILDLLGLDGREELIGESIFDIIHPDDRDVARRELETVIERKESTGPTRMRLRPPGVGVRYIHVSTAVGTFLGDDIGQAIAIDMTDREERDRQLRVLDQWLRHNIRNEMTLIKGVADDIRRGAVDDVTEAANLIQDHATRLVEQTNHEREIINILAPSADRTPSTVDLVDVVERQVAECRRAFPEADIGLVAADGVDVVALPEIGLAVRELIKNAIQHNDAGTPTVEVELAVRPDGTGIVRVADDSPGIPEEERDCLLLDREIDQLNHSSGLGLVLVYWVVRLSDGELTFEENDPRGSVVTVTLPRPD